METIHLHDEEAELLTPVDELMRPAAEGLFPQSHGELGELLDPYGNYSSDYLLENH